MGQELKKDSLSCIRLVSHLYYMLVRTRTGEGVNIDLNDFMETSYPRANETARIVCEYMEETNGATYCKGRNRFSGRTYPESRSVRKYPIEIWAIA